MNVNALRTFVVYDVRDFTVLETMDSMTLAFEARRDYPGGIAQIAGRWAYEGMRRELDRKESK